VAGPHRRRPALERSEAKTRVSAPVHLFERLTQRTTRPAWVSLVELIVFLTLVFTFIWLWSRGFRHADRVVLGAGVLMTLGAHWYHRERPSDLGFRLDNLRPALRDAAAMILPLIALIAIHGWWTGHWDPKALGAERFVGLLTWGLFQQYLLQGYVHRRLIPLVPWPPLREVVVGLIFAALHLPNPVLVPVTFATGFVFAVLYRRHPNLFVLALCHAVGSTAVAYGFDPEILHKMRVGPGYFRL
jgi:hypothetical protein